MFKKLAIIFLATLFLASCAGKPDFDFRTQVPTAKTYIEVPELDGDPVIILSLIHISEPTRPY